MPRLALIALALLPALAGAQEPLLLTAEEAMALALRDNPELAAQRQRAGIAAADIVIARDLPVNPQYSAELRGATGPASQVLNHFTTFHAVLFTLQPKGARQMRVEAASAGLSRAEAEIAHHETKLALAVYRAVHEVLYRQERIALAEKVLQTTEKTREQMSQLQKVIRLAEIDLLLLRTDAADAKAQLFAARQAHLAAAQELRRLLAMPTGGLRLRGQLNPAPLHLDEAELKTLALQRRADLQAREAAALEAEARLRLERANRYGNPAIGPSYELNETRVSFIGAQLTMPIPVNSRRGQIQQREAELTRALLEVRQTEAEIQADVHAALEQWRQAEAEVKLFEKDLLPELRESLSKAETMVKQGFEGADLAKLLEFQRRLAKAEEGLLNARWNMIAARARLAAAVGDAGLAAQPSQNRD